MTANKANRHTERQTADGHTTGDAYLTNTIKILKLHVLLKQIQTTMNQLRVFVCLGVCLPISVSVCLSAYVCESVLIYSRSKVKDASHAMQ